MSSVRLALFLLVLPVPLLAEQPSALTKNADPDAVPVPVIKLAPQSTGPAPRSRYNLLPRRSDLVPGNAALLWNRAGQAAREVTKKPNEDWFNRQGSALKDLPKKEVRDVLSTFSMALRLADQAALRDHCDRELPPFRFDYWDFPFSDIQGCRELARLLSLRCRLELSEGDFDKAAQSLRTGLTLARHLGDSDTMIEGLVGIAISAIMFGLVEEWMQIPGSPNLYWSLTALPVPFIDIRRSMEFELNNLDRAFPDLRQLVKGTADPAQLSVMIVKLAESMEGLTGRGVPEWEIRAGLVGLTAKLYPDARQSLLDSGYKVERLDAMSPVQVVLLQQMEQFDHYRDEVLKLMTLPPWQARGRLADVELELRRQKQRITYPFISLLFPAVIKVYEARIRLEQTVAGLRCGEALRLYAADHDGKAPAKFADLTVPLPVDPITGKGFDNFYTAKDGRGVLNVLSVMPEVPQLGRRFEIGPGR